MARRLAMRGSAIVVLGTALAVESAAAQSDDAALRRAKTILQLTPIIDTHNDLPWVIREKGSPPRDVESYDISKRARFDTDIPRLRAGASPRSLVLKAGTRSRTR